MGLFCDTRGHFRTVQEISQDREQVGMIYESRNHRLVGSAGDGVKTTEEECSFFRAWINHKCRVENTDLRNGRAREKAQ